MRTVYRLVQPPSQIFLFKISSHLDHAAPLPLHPPALSLHRLPPNCLSRVEAPAPLSVFIFSEYCLSSEFLSWTCKNSRSFASKPLVHLLYSFYLLSIIYSLYSLYLYYPFLHSHEAGPSPHQLERTKTPAESAPTHLPSFICHF